MRCSADVTDSSHGRASAASSWPRRIVLVVGLLSVASVATWLRVPDEARNQLWAEDGRRFLGDALAAPNPFEPLLTPYAGYLHFIPRVVAGVTAGTVSLGQLPIMMTALSVLVSSTVAVLVFTFSRCLNVGILGQVGVYGVTFLAPALTTEVLGDAANLHWFFLWLAPWLFLYRPKANGQALLCGILALVTALTEIQVAIFLPLFLWHVKRDRRSWIAVGTVMGLAGQVVATITHPRAYENPFEWSWPSVTLVAKGFTAHVCAGLWTAMTPGPQLVAKLGWLGVTAVLLAPVAVAALWLCRTRTHRLIVLYYSGTALALWAVASVTNNLPREVLEPLSSDGAPSIAVIRNAVVPAWLLAAVLIVGADSMLRYRRGRSGASAASLLLVAVFISWAAAFRLDAGMRQQSSSWADEVARAKAVCASGVVDSVVLSHPPTTWGLEVPCEVIRAKA